MLYSAPICSDLSYLFLGCNSIYSVTDFPKQGKMEQDTAGCSSKMVVKIGVVYYRYFIALSGTYFQFPLYHTRQCFSTEKNALHPQSAFLILYCQTTRNIFWVTGFSPVVLFNSALAAFSSSIRIISSLASSKPRWV